MGTKNVSSFHNRFRKPLTKSLTMVTFFVHIFVLSSSTVSACVGIRRG